MSVVRAELHAPAVISIAQRQGMLAVVPTGQSGPPGPMTNWRMSSGWIQARAVGYGGDWTNVVELADITPPMPAHQWNNTQLRFETAPGVWGPYVDLKGDAVEIGVDGGFIRWRPVGGAWTNIVELADLIGPDGPAIEVQTTATHIQWRVVGDPTWINLVALADLKGDQGDPGPIGINLPLGPWNSATAYVARDVVTLNGSSYICLLGHTNQSPPTPPATANTYWSLLASKGDTPTVIDLDAVEGLNSELLGSAHSAITVAATDIVAEFVYDTTLDDDKGAWRHRCAHTSWWRETLNTATRGSKREFPQKAKLVLRAGSMTIYDLTDLDASGAAKMWMVFNGGGNAVYYVNSNAAPACCFALNGVLWVASAGTAGALCVIDFRADDTAIRIEVTINYYPREIAKRNTSVLSERPDAFPAGLVSRDVRWVHARVFPGAPVDAYGLPIPKVVVATAGGVSVIHEDGVVYDITGFYSPPTRVALLSDGIFVTGEYSVWAEIHAIPYSDMTIASARRRLYADATVPSSLSYRYLISVAAVDALAEIGAGDLAVGSSAGLTFVARNADPALEMVAYSTAQYATGWQVGDIRGAYLCDTTTGNITGGTVSDRSYKASALSVVGTLSRTAVNTGNDLVAFSGFSGSNYLLQPYNPDLDFGTGDFAYVFWAKMSTNAGTLFRRSAVISDVATDGVSLVLYTYGSGTLCLRISNGSAFSYYAETGVGRGDNVWHLIALVRRSGSVEFWVDGQFFGSHSIGLDLSAAGSQLVIGYPLGGVGPADQMALFRISATAPSAAQIARMYRDELPLFNAGAKACLGGTSNAIAAMDFDTWSQRLLVGTGDGVSEFSGLVRVGYFDTSNTPLTNDAMKAVAAQGGYRSMAGGQQSIVVRDKVSQHDVVNAYPEQLPAAVVNELAAIRALALLGTVS